MSATQNAVAALDDQGIGPEQIARQLGMTRHRVEWILDQLAEEIAPITPRSDIAPVLEPLSPGATVLQPDQPVERPARRSPRTAPVPAGPIKHGTPYGAIRHRKDGTPICDECLQAHRDYKRDYQRKARAAGTKDRPLKPAATSAVRVIYLVPPTTPGDPYLEYAVSAEHRITTVSAETARIEATQGADVLVRTVTPWRPAAIPTTSEGETA